MNWRPGYWLKVPVTTVNWCYVIKYKYPTLSSKVCCAPFHFGQKPASVPVLANQKNSEDFCFYKKRLKEKITFSVHFAAIHLEAGCTTPLHPQQGRASSRKPHAESLHQSTTALNCVCEPLCFILIYFVHLLARCVLR